MRSEPDIVLARQLVRKLTQELKFSLVDQTKMITAASELSRNTVTYGGGGEMQWELVEQCGKRGPGLQLRDEGKDRERLVVFTPGDSISPQTRDRLERADRPVLRKPFALDDLRDILDRLA